MKFLKLSIVMVEQDRAIIVREKESSILDREVIALAFSIRIQRVVAWHGFPQAVLAWLTSTACFLLADAAVACSPSRRTRTCFAITSPDVAFEHVSSLKGTIARGAAMGAIGAVRATVAE